MPRNVKIRRESGDHPVLSKKKGMRSPIRIASLFVWALLSLAAGGLAVETLLMQDNDGFPQLFSGVSSSVEQNATPVAGVAARPVVNDAQASRRQKDMENRLASLMRSLEEIRRNNVALVRQQSENGQRLARMEDAFESITASLAPAAEPPQSPQIPDGGLPLPTLKPTTSNNDSERAQPNALSQSRVPFPTPAKDDLFDDVEGREAIPQLTVTSPETASATQVMQTEFAVSVAHYTDIEVLVQSWYDLKERHFETLQNLEPRIRFENTMGSGLELALIAGPLRNAGDAALLCVELGLTDKGCKPVVYSGEAIPSLTAAEIPQ